MTMPLLAYVATFSVITFSEQLDFQMEPFQTLTQQLLFPNSYFFRAVTFLEQQLFKSATSSRQLFFSE